MKNFVFILVLAFSFKLVAQSKQYVCLPCGSSCDAKVYEKPGTCSNCSMKLVEKSTLKFSNLSLEEWCTRLKANSNVVLLDVRSPQEFKGGLLGGNSYGHFKGAININITELEDRLAELEKYKDSEVLVYCSHSMRSPRASYILSTNGFKNVKNLSGGISTISPQQANDCLKKFYEVH